MCSMIARSPGVARAAPLTGELNGAGLPDDGDLDLSRVLKFVLDSAGDVWCALYGAGRIARYAPGGQLKEVHSLPCPSVTSCSFGGEGLSTLYVTTGWSPGVRRPEDEPCQGGALFSIEVDAQGLPEPEFDPEAAV